MNSKFIKFNVCFPGNYGDITHSFILYCTAVFVFHPLEVNTRTGEENDFYVGNHLLLAAPVYVVLLPPRDETGGRRRRQTALYSTENQWTQAVDYSGERYYCPPTQVRGKRRRRNKSCSFPVLGKGKKRRNIQFPTKLVY